MIKKITQDQIYMNSVERLADRPTAASRYGTGGMPASELKSKYDALAKLAITKLGEVIDSLNADAAAVESVLKSTKTQVEDGLGGYKTLYEVLGDILDGDMSGYFALNGLKKDNLHEELSDIETDITAIKGNIGAKSNTSNDNGSLHARINKAKDDIATNALGIFALNSNKVDKVSGKALSTNDFTDALKYRLENIAAGAEVNVQANWSQSDVTSDAYIQNKPNVGVPADGADPAGTMYARIKHNYDASTANTAAIGDEQTSATVQYRIKTLEGLVSSLGVALGTAQAMIEARQHPIAINSMDYLSKWLQGVGGYTVSLDGKEITPADLITGTVIILRATNEPDLWWDGEIGVAGTITVNGIAYASTGVVNGAIVGGVHELEYNYTEVDAAVTAAEDAQGAAEDAQGKAETARDTAKKWATGEGALSSDEQYENNAKFYSEEASASANAADTSAGIAQAAADQITVTDLDTNKEYIYKLQVIGGKPFIYYQEIGG